MKKKFTRPHMSLLKPVSGIRGEPRTQTRSRFARRSRGHTSVIVVFYFWVPRSDDGTRTAYPEHGCRYAAAADCCVFMPCCVALEQPAMWTAKVLTLCR